MACSGAVAWIETQPPAGAPTATSPVLTTSPSPTSPAQTPTAAQTPQPAAPPPGKCPDEIVIGTPVPISGRYAAETQWLKGRRRQKAGTFSGGELQMLAIVRALMSRPRVLLIDEPSAGLAPKVVSDLFQTVKRLKEEMSVLLVERNVAAALEISDYAYVIENGRIIIQGRPEVLAANEHVEKAYLGV
jgi:hypothetical protein